MSVWSQGQRPEAPPSSCWSDWRGTCPSWLGDGYGDECQNGGGEGGGAVVGGEGAGEVRKGETVGRKENNCSES